jgi:hypothetical protein
MGVETSEIEYEQKKAKTDLETQTKAMKENIVRLLERGEITFLGTRGLLMNPIPACEKIDQLFGSGSESIVHYMFFECGQSLFDNMIKCKPNESQEKLLKALVEAQPRAGWGHVSLKFIRVDPPIVELAAINSPVKTTKGSQKHLIGAFWAGALSRYFNHLLMCKNFNYDVKKDEFSCVIVL